MGGREECCLRTADLNRVRAGGQAGILASRPNDQTM
eukprot:CAMPEP_0119065048 /NCGR_PEP_ID=MMETSP1178-20130426/7963_1 /TAXON_ID=33656 /ORGANISM="unid sp, Strain CCMP2000" /LENGTH=35 /DNA_ID= /DNA_START= /DNA_END= /DNA_ORIENTATION=